MKSGRGGANQAMFPVRDDTVLHPNHAHGTGGVPAVIGRLEIDGDKVHAGSSQNLRHHGTDARSLQTGT